MDEYVEYMKELGLTEQDNWDEASELAKALYNEGLLTDAELAVIMDRL